MSENTITKEKVYATLGKHICGELIDHKGPIDGLYNYPRDKDEDVWIVYPSSGFNYVGASRTIVISKKTGIDLWAINTWEM